MHGRAFAAVEHSELDAGGVDHLTHRSAKGVDFADDLPLADAADRRVAAHLADRVAVGRQQGCFCAEARGGERGLGTGMACTDDEDVVMVGDFWHDFFCFLCAGGVGQLSQWGQ